MDAIKTSVLTLDLDVDRKSLDSVINTTIE